LNKVFVVIRIKPIIEPKLINSLVTVQESMRQSECYNTIPLHDTQALDNEFRCKAKRRIADNPIDRPIRFVVKKVYVYPIVIVRTLPVILGSCEVVVNSNQHRR